MVGSASCSGFLFEHDLFGRPVSTFPDHVLTEDDPLPGGSWLPQERSKARQVIADMTARAHNHRRWEATLRHAMQTAIGHELKVTYQPPTELTQELAALLAKLNRPKDGRKQY